MNRKTAYLIISAAIFTAFLVSSVAAKEGTGASDKAEDKSDKGLVTIELKDGESVLARIARETRDDVYVVYPDAEFEVSMPRFKIENIRKPTAKELENSKKRLPQEGK